MPVHASFGGFCSVFVLGLSGYCVARLGTAVSVCLSVSGQLFMSAIVDHFGLFGTEKVSFHSIRIPGFLCILAGIFIINFAGADSFSSIDSRGILFLMLLLALVIGFVTVMARMFTYEATRYVGRFGASCINSLVGSAGALVLILITTGFRPSLSGYVEAPLVSYLTGPLGTVSCYLSNIAYDKIKVFLRHDLPTGRTDCRRHRSRSLHAGQFPSRKNHRHCRGLRRNFLGQKNTPPPDPPKAAGP